MHSIVSRLDAALKSLEAQGLSPVTIVLVGEDHEALAEIGEWPVTVTARGELRYRSIPVFKAREGEGGSLVGRGPNGSTKRMGFSSQTA